MGFSCELLSRGLTKAAHIVNEMVREFALLELTGYSKKIGVPVNEDGWLVYCG